jgi:NAD(P)-dependent dehydrogenase (short-subunit alcohol dehydrogenase family)
MQVQFLATSCIGGVDAPFPPSVAATIDDGAAKAAVVNLINLSLGSSTNGGIRVNCVSPGQSSTDLSLGEHGVAETVARATGATARDGRAKAVASIAHRPLQRAREGRDLITILASERTANLTGVNYVIDGGLIRTT